MALVITHTVETPNFWTGYKQTPPAVVSWGFLGSSMVIFTVSPTCCITSPTLTLILGGKWSCRCTGGCIRFFSLAFSLPTGLSYQTILCVMCSHLPVWARGRHARLGAQTVSEGRNFEASNKGLARGTLGPGTNSREHGVLYSVFG